MSAEVLGERRRRYSDRHHAGRVLARELQHLVGRGDVIVLGLPRGGVPVASEIAQALGAPLDLFVVHLLPVPEHPEVAMGAIATGGIRVLDRDLIDALAMPWCTVASVTREQHESLLQRERVYRNGRRPFSLTHRSVILVDDGAAPGSTLHAAVQAVRALKPAEVIVAVPAASTALRDDLVSVADQVVCPLVPATLADAGEYYNDFVEPTDIEIRALLGLPATAPALVS